VYGIDLLSRALRRIGCGNGGKRNDEGLSPCQLGVDDESRLMIDYTHAEEDRSASSDLGLDPYRLLVLSHMANAITNKNAAKHRPNSV
jgi:hypothetical protein